MKKKLLFSFVALLGGMQAGAYTCKVDGICYNCNTENQTATVTYSGYPHNNDYTGAYGYSLTNKNVVIPSTITYNDVEYTVTAIGDYAFYDSESTVKMSSVTIPSTVTSIGKAAFWGCEKLTTITIPGSVKTIGESAFSRRDPDYYSSSSSLAEIIIEEGVTSIGGCAFNLCSELTSINIPSSVTSIGNYAFDGCNKLTSISVASGNTVYDSREDCNAIIETASNTIIAGFNSTIIPSSVTSIGDRAFYRRYYLTSITIPSNVTSIGSLAFYGCSRLTSIVSKIKVPFAFGSTAFGDISSDCVLTVPYGTRDAYIAAGWTTSIFGGGIKEMVSTIEMSSNEICTFCCDYDLDFSSVSGLKAYIACGFNQDNGKVLMVQVQEVPAKTGLLLKGAEGSYTIPVNTTSYYYLNLLKPVFTATIVPETEGGYTNYVLANGANGVQFYKSNNASLSANKAYLQLPTKKAEARSMIEWEIADDATAVRNILMQTKQQDAVYNLNGQRVTSPHQGIYVKNGKKVFIK